MSEDKPRDRHQGRRLTVRPPEDVRAAAQAVIDKRKGWTMNDFIASCLNALSQVPDSILASLEPYKIETPKGRPRKAVTEKPAALGKPKPTPKRAAKKATRGKP